MILSIPFSGFYESIHDSQIESALFNGVFTDYLTGCDNNDNLSNRAYDSMNWRELRLEYCRAYVDYMAGEFEINMQFESLSSPREYNFVTDRIFVTIPDNEFLRLYSETNKQIFEKNIKDNFTSRDGFISFYSNNLSEWPINPLEFDNNEAACLFEAWIISNYDDFELSDFEWRFIESKSYNGFFDELIYKHCENKRLFTIHNYLNERLCRDFSARG